MNTFLIVAPGPEFDMDLVVRAKSPKKAIKFWRRFWKEAMGAQPFKGPVNYGHLIGDASEKLRIFEVIIHKGAKGALSWSFDCDIRGAPVPPGPAGACQMRGWIDNNSKRKKK